MKVKVESQLEAITFLSFINSYETRRAQPVFNIQQNKAFL